MRAVFCDTETTGLLAHRGHEVWEFGAVVCDDVSDPDAHYKVNFIVQPKELWAADPGALAVNNFYARTANARKHGATSYSNPPEEGKDKVQTNVWWERGRAAEYISELFAGALMVANNPGFDAEMLTQFCLKEGQVFAPFHRKVNVVDVALGVLYREIAAGNNDALREVVAPPHSSSKVLSAAGCPPNTGAHTALGDAEHVFAAWRHLTQGVR